jgi:hypothetical protein
MTIMHMPRIKRKSRTPILAVPFVTATEAAEYYTEQHGRTSSNSNDTEGGSKD